MRKIRKLSYLLACLLVIPLYYALAAEKAEDAVHPDRLSQFTVPSSLLPLLGDYRQNWTRLTGVEPSGLHWNQKVVVYTNEDADIYRHNHLTFEQLLAYDEDEAEEDEEPSFAFKTYAPGTIILKENYIANAQPFVKPASVTVMMKQDKGYDPAMGDWRFVQFDTTGHIVVDGSSQDPGVNIVCAFCHRSMADRDYVFSTVSSTQEDEK